MRAWAEREAAKAPPLTPEARARLARLLTVEPTRESPPERASE